jgi:hypothetical protein
MRRYDIGIKWIYRIDNRENEVIEVAILEYFMYKYIIKSK